jgi:hypothetical protein
MSDSRFSQKLQNFDVSFDDKGNLTESHLAHRGFTTKKNSFFYDKIIYVGYTVTYSGKSKFVFKSLVSGTKYYMFISDFDDILQEGILNHKIVEGVFSFKKRGRKQGIRFVKS